MSAHCEAVADGASATEIVRSEFRDRSVDIARQLANVRLQSIRAVSRVQQLVVEDAKHRVRHALDDLGDRQHAGRQAWDTLPKLATASVVTASGVAS